MAILHPIFIVIFLFLAYASYYEIYRMERKQPIFTVIAGVLIVIAIGLRLDAGADYPVYNRLYYDFPIYVNYSDLWDKALFRPNTIEIEWIYVLINKLLFEFAAPFYIVTLVMAIITVSLKLSTIYKFIAFPALSIFFYFMPIVFFEDGGQMRQGIGIAICVYSFRFIIKRKLTYFLLCMFLALGFHKTSIVFLPAYWLVRIPLKTNHIFWILLISILISPLELYRFGGGLFTAVAPADIGSAYTGYSDDAYYGGEVETGLNDIVKLFYIAILIRYDKEGCRKIWWYEYMRNLAVFGLAMFYFFRANQIFAIRLPGAYMFFLTMFCMPNIVYAVRDEVKRILYIGFMSYFTMMFFYFGKGNGSKGGFGWDNYKNAIWS